MGVNANFGLIQTNKSHTTPNYESENICLKLVIIDRRTFLQKRTSYQKKLEKSGQEVMYSSQFFNFNSMECVGYETCEILIWTSGEGCRNKNSISKQGIPKIIMNMTSPS